MIICFSATASFTIGIGLLAMGAVTLRLIRHKAELPYAAIPVIFGVQQLIEGGLWLGLPVQSPLAHMLAVAYLLFANVLWAFYVPFAIWMIEPSKPHRKRMAWTMAIGVAVAMFFLGAMMTHPVSATIEAMHIKYHLPHPHKHIVFAFYAVATCLTPLLSSFKTLRWFGAMLILSMLGSYAIYAMWFASVWCFFAALISVIVVLHFTKTAAHLRGHPA
jgi:hypothetical protein